MLLGALAACSPAGAQNTPTPAAETTDVFDPAVAAATPIAGVETFDVASAGHTADDVDYAQDPPAGGPHDPSWQKRQVYAAPIRAEHAVPSQEHGAVWITYQPDLPDEDVEALAAYAEDQPHVPIVPYRTWTTWSSPPPGAPSSAWTRLPTPASRSSSTATPATAPSAARPATAAWRRPLGDGVTGASSSFSLSP